MYTLITGAAASAAYKVKNRLAIEDVIMGDYAALPSTMLSDKIVQLPDPASTSYAHQMLTLCLDKGIVRVYLIRQEEWKPLQEAEELFGEYGIELIVETRYFASPADR
jgi:hypothetical protein